MSSDENGQTKSPLVFTDRCDSRTSSAATWAWIGLSEGQVYIEFQTWLVTTKESLLSPAELATIRNQLNTLIMQFPKTSGEFQRRVERLEEENRDLWLDGCRVWLKHCPRATAESDVGYVGRDLYWDDPGKVEGCFYAGHHSGLDEAQLSIRPAGASQWLVRFHAIGDAQNTEISFEGTVNECSPQDMFKL